MTVALLWFSLGCLVVAGVGSTIIAFGILVALASEIMEAMDI